MLKRRRDPCKVDKDGNEIEEKRARGVDEGGQTQTTGDSDMTSNIITPNSQETKTQKSKNQGPLKKNDNASGDDTMEEKADFQPQKSFDGDDSASDKGSMIEETNSQFCQEILDAVLKMKDSNGRMICELFLKLPPRQQYPEYYKVIKEPIDLKMIYSHVKNSGYSSMDEIERDLNLLVKNAHAFNEPGSQVYKDATAIKKMVMAKRQEIEHTLSGAKSSKRLRSKRTTSKMSFAISALLSESDDEEDLLSDATQLLEEDERNKNDVDEAEDPFRALYNSVRKYSDYSGRILSEAFMRLPSKRAYPDYYEVIKNPVGLLKIGSNIKNGSYASLEILAEEINQCFENAKHYNETESMLYQDAATLQDVLLSRKSEIEKLCSEKGVELTGTIKKAPKIAEQTGQEDYEMESKEHFAVSARAQGKKSSKKQLLSETERLQLKKRMREMYEAVEKYQDENGRYLSELFFDLPSADAYPDYYEIITEPTCLRIIGKNMEDGKYQTEHQFMLDFEIMFENAKHYNEVGSQVHQDALTLDRVLKKKRKSLGRSHIGQGENFPSPSSTTKQQQKSSSTPSKQITPTKSSRSGSARTSQAGGTTDVKELCKELYNSVKDFTDNTGRYLCAIFQKLPSRTDYPDYYALIKRPIDMTRISSKLHAEQYNSLEECLQDFVLMFDNACKYNDPDSQVYKDSLVLLRELLATKLELLGDCELHVPEVAELVQKMLEDLYNSLVYHQNDEGRCFSDSLLGICVGEVVDENGQKRFILSLPLIGKLIQKRYYKRLDKLQDDLFTFFEKARTHPVDSEVYDDAVELQQFFVQERDRVCKDGERFVSPAISQTKRHLLHELDEERKHKMKVEVLNVMESGENRDTIESGATQLSQVKAQDDVIDVGDYVYVNIDGDQYVVGVEKIWNDNNDEKFICGPWFYRPEQISCDKRRKFLHKEVIRCNKKTPVNVKQIRGLCHVMYIKSYIRSKPHDFDEKEVFVCESAYCLSRKLFQKIKNWPGLRQAMRYVPREIPLTVKRSSLSEDDGNENEKNDDEKLIASLFQIHEERKNLAIETPKIEGVMSYEQYCVNSASYKLGDTVYCKTDEGYCTVARIDKIWSDRQGMAYFCGTTFIKPEDTQHLPTHMFYDKEVFHVPVDEVHRMCDIVRKCCVLPIREYMRCRPTDVPEDDIFLCESRYDEDDGGHYRKLKGLKRPTLSTNVYEEEFHFFEETLNLVKKPSPLLVKDMSELRRDDKRVSPAPAGLDLDSGKSVKKRPRTQSGFLLFSAERRGILRKQYPDYGFGDISRLVGTEWKNLSSMKKEEWDAKGSLQSVSAKGSLSSNVTSYAASPGLVYDCLWQGCDYQYEDLRELIIHVLESGGHLTKMENGVCPCFWRNCERLKRGLKPFNSLTKLIRHCREIHLKGPARHVELHERSKNYFPKNQAPPQPEHSSPDPVSSNDIQPPGNQAYMGVVPSPTPSQILAQSVNASLLDQQFSNVMRMTTPGLSQNMMGLTNNFSNQIMPTLPPQNLQPTNIQRPVSMMNGSSIPGPAMNQFAQVSSLGASVVHQQQPPQQPLQQQQQQQQQQQLVNTLQPFPSAYQQVPQDQVPLSYPQQPIAAQQAQLGQTRPAISNQNQSMLPNRPSFLDTQTADVQMTPLFHSPPPRQQKLLHSDTYLRYIEGLRDGTAHLSNWNPNKPDVNKLTAQQQSQLPVQWLGTAFHPHTSTVDALWALREHMLNDAIKLAKFTNNTS